MTYIKEQLSEKFEQLPEDVQEAIIAVETAEVVSNLGTKYALHVDQAGELADEIGLVMLGLTKPTEFVNHIIARLGLDRAVAEGMAREVNEQIFLKIRESLQTLHENKADPDYGVEMLPGPKPPAPSTLLGTSEAVPDKKEVIAGIEHPKEAKEGNVFEQKMGKLFRIPREEVDLDLYNEKPQ